MPKFFPYKDTATTRISTTTMALIMAGIVAALLFVGYLFDQASREAHVNQPSTQSLAQDKIPDTSKTD